MTRRKETFIGALLLVLALGLPAAGAASSQPDGTGPVPPVTVAPGAGDSSQPDGTGPIPAVMWEAPETQPPNLHPDSAGAPTTVRGPVEPVAGGDGADRPGGREDGGEINGADLPGGRRD